MKLNFSEKEKQKAEELLQRCYHISVEEISGKCVPLKIIGQKSAAILIASEMVKEYGGPNPKESWEEERLKFWKNVLFILESIRF
jgi:hypothetical protein